MGFLVATGDDGLPPTYAWDKYFVLMDVVVAMALLISLFAVISAIRIWFKSDLRAITKVKYSFVGVACVVLCWFAIHWHLIGPIRI
jgi:hypothetical protein